MSNRRFDGQVAIVTGGSRGIGLAIAQRLVDEGARVCITARKQDALDAAVETLGGAEHAIAVAGGADNADHQDDVVARTLEAFGRIDLLINNTGINPVYGPVLETPFEAARKIFEVNCLATLAWTSKVYNAWMRVHGGAVVILGSVAAVRPAPGIGMYGASKAMLTHLTAELALELAPVVRVNGVAPAVVKTDFASLLYKGKEAEVTAGYPLGRLGRPADVAGATAFLLSQDAAWMTGQMLVLDGGATLTGGIE